MLPWNARKLENAQCMTETNSKAMQCIFYGMYGKIWGQLSLSEVEKSPNMTNSEMIRVFLGGTKLSQWD